MSYAVVNPATGETVTSYPTISDADLDAAIAAAAAAHRDWSRTTTPEERAALVRRVGDLHAERRDELARSSCARWGSPSSRRSPRSTSPPTSTGTTPTSPPRSCVTSP